ncbi:unnamed protein product [Symbiodinium sp. CCMP2592]|nr:unnamed protein product [Symbiodinium sp. CCMP2592]
MMFIRPFLHAVLLAHAVAKDSCLSSVQIIDDFLHDGEASRILEKVRVSELLIDQTSVVERIRQAMDVPEPTGVEVDGSVIPSRIATGNVSEHQDNDGEAVTNSSSAVIYLESAPDGGSLGKLVFKEKKMVCSESQVEMEVEAIGKRLVSWDNDACLHSFHARHEGARHLLGPLTVSPLGSMVGVGGNPTTTTVSTTTSASMTMTSSTSMTMTDTSTTSMTTTMTDTMTSTATMTMTDTMTTMTDTVTETMTMTETVTQAGDLNSVSAAEGCGQDWLPLPFALSCLLGFLG